MVMMIQRAAAGVGISISLVSSLALAQVLPEPDAPPAGPSEGDSSDGPGEPVPLGFCGQWPSQLVDDFEDGDLAVNDGFGGWFSYNDGTALQTPSDGLLLIAPGGANPSALAGHSSGGAFQEWGAGFGVALGCSYDVSDFGGLRFLVQSEASASFIVQLPTLPILPAEYGGECLEGCDDQYGYAVTVETAGWYECTVRFDDLAQAGWGAPTALDTSSVTGLQFNIEAPDTPYELSVDDVGFAGLDTMTGCRLLEVERVESACSPGDAGRARRHLDRRARGSRAKERRH